VLKLQRTRLSPHDQQTTITTWPACISCRQVRQGRAAYARCSRIARQGRESDLTADALSKLGQCLLKTEKFAEPESLLRDAMRSASRSNRRFNVFNVNRKSARRLWAKEIRGCGAVARAGL